MAPPDFTLLEVVAYVPTDFFHCLHCERVFDVAHLGAEARREARAGYPSQMLEEARRLALLLLDLTERYGEQLRIRVIDLPSPEGFYKSLRYWIRRYPAFIVNRRQKYVGWDPEAVERLLADCAG